MWFLVLINGGETCALRSIRMEGMWCFASKNKGFCMQIKMDGKLSQTELSSFELLSIFDLVSCFPIIKFLVLGSNAKIKAFPNLEMLGKFMLLH